MYCKQHLCGLLANEDEFHSRNDPFLQDSTVVRILKKPLRQLQTVYDRRYRDKTQKPSTGRSRKAITANPAHLAVRVLQIDHTRSASRLAILDNRSHLRRKSMASRPQTVLHTMDGRSVKFDDSASRKGPRALGAHNRWEGSVGTSLSAHVRYNSVIS
jgi:hypothetical protein